MKTAEEWCDSSCFLAQLGPIIKQIQLDAMKEGMRRAAKVVLLSPTQYKYKDCDNDSEMHAHLAGECDMIDKNEQAILAAAEQLTEKDL